MVLIYMSKYQNLSWSKNCSDVLVCFYLFIFFNFSFLCVPSFSFAEPPAFEVLPSLKKLKQRIIAAGRGEYDAVFMSGRYQNWKT